MSRSNQRALGRTFLIVGALIATVGAVLGAIAGELILVVLAVLTLSIAATSLLLMRR